jgi:hypothetical protein
VTFNDKDVVFEVIEGAPRPTHCRDNSHDDYEYCCDCTHYHAPGTFCPDILDDVVDGGCGDARCCRP